MLLVSGSTRSVAKQAKTSDGRLGHLLTPNNGNSMQSILKTGLPWAADNAAFSNFDSDKYMRMLNKIKGQPGCLWVVAPDVVANARETRNSLWHWHPCLRWIGQPIAYVAQDGQDDLEMPLPQYYDALFIGGSTAFKLSAAAADLAERAKRMGKLVHMGRVNSKRRMEAAKDMGCDSVDGSSASMFGDTYIPKYLKWLEQIDRQGSFTRTSG